MNAGDLELTLRLQPPIGSSGRQELDAVMQRLRKQARDAGKKNGRAIWRQYFLIRDAFASLGPAAVLTVHRSQGSSFGDVFVAPDVFRADPASASSSVTWPCPVLARGFGCSAARRRLICALPGSANSTPRGIPSESEDQRSEAQDQGRQANAHPQTHNAEQGSPEGFVFGVKEVAQDMPGALFASCAIWQQVRKGAMDRAGIRAENCPFLSRQL